MGVGAFMAELVAEGLHGGWEWGWQWWQQLRVPHGLSVSKWRAERLCGG